MDRAEAIKRLEWLHMVGNHVDSVTLCKEDMGYFDMAIAALREQEQREQVGFTEVYDRGEFVGWKCKCGVVRPEKTPFCPMCGRKLKEGAE